MSGTTFSDSLLTSLAIATVILVCGTVRAEDATAKGKRRPVILTNDVLQLHRRALVIDGHNDLPWELRSQGSISFERLDLSQPIDSLHTDILRLRQGGIGAQFWSVYVPASTAYDATALVTTLEQIELVHAMIDRYPETFELALTVDDIERIYQAGKIASLIGVEGGHCIENSLNVLNQLYRLGARYMTLTHSDSLDWADSATDEPKCGGLSEFGEQVVLEMNKLGMLVDLSHVSDDAMKDALRVTKAPVIFSHSSARAVADHPRNVTDEVLRLTSDNGGVVMVNFYSAYVVPSSAKRSYDRLKEQQRLKKTLDEVSLRAALRKWDAGRKMEAGTIHDMIDHIDHVVEVAGIDHVGLGSDYDGVSVLPKQIEDVSSYPYITQELVNRGYTEEEILKILGGNLLRVMRAAEQIAKEIE